MEQVWNLPGPARPGYVPRLGRSVAFLSVLALGLVISTLLAGLVTYGHHALAFRMLAQVLAALANVGLYFLAIPGPHPEGRAVAPAAARRDRRAASSGPCSRRSAPTWSTTTCAPTRSTVSSPPCSGWWPGSTSASRRTVYAAEVNVVLARRLWPRALVQPPLTEADRAIDGTAGAAEPAARRTAGRGHLQRPAGRDTGADARRRRRRRMSRRPASSRWPRPPPGHTHAADEERMTTDAAWPGSQLPARRDLRRRGHELRDVLRGGRAGRAVPVRAPAAHEERVALHRGRRLRLARLPARHRSWPALRLPRARPVRPGGRVRCNPAKLLLDPYAKAIEGAVTWGQPVFGYQFGDQEQTRTAPTPRRTCRAAVVANPYFDWGNDRPPRTPYHQSVIYEAHVRGLTRLHPAVPGRPARHLRGPGAPGRDRAPGRPRRHRRRADAGAPVRQRRLPGRPRPVQLLGLQHDRVLRAAQRLLLGAAS